MEKSAHSVLKLTPASVFRNRAAFSLVEVTIAIGIVAFAFTAIFGLLPVGLGIFRQALNISITQQIAQRTLSQIQQSDFSTIVTGTYAANATFLYQSPTKYDDTGAKVGTTIYWVNTRIMPATDLPGTGNSAMGPDNPNIATVTIQVAFNPGDRALATGTNNLWTTTGSNAIVPIYTYTAQIAK